MTEFSDEDIGDYTIEMYNKFGYAMCLVQLQPHGEHNFPASTQINNLIIDSFQIILREVW